jgi:hypothetical protein
VVLCSALAACATSGKGDKERSPERRAREPDVIFSHVKHKGEADCDTCHKGVKGTTALKKRHSPAKAVCAECHEVKDKKECKKCHRDPARAAKLPRLPSTPGVIFSHAKHQKQAKECVVCHAGVAVAESLADLPRPKMKQDCLGCHNHLKEYRKLKCRACHQSLSYFPIRFVSAFNHEGNFLKEHGRWGRANADLCASCHDQTYCADCHSTRSGVKPSLKWAEQSGRRFIHRGDWLSQHALQSRGNPGNCTRCHSPKTCARCHRSRGIHVSSRVPAATPGAAAGGRSPHPVDWLSPTSPNGHGREARRRITHCASCHDRGALSNCVRCHRSTARGGLGLRPHPPGWSRSNKAGKPCVYCH